MSQTPIPPDPVDPAPPATDPGEDPNRRAARRLKWLTMSALLAFLISHAFVDIAVDDYEGGGLSIAICGLIGTVYAGLETLLARKEDPPK